MKKRIFSILTVLLLILAMTSGTVFAYEPSLGESPAKGEAGKDIAILFTNDIHGNFTNVKKPNGISYAKIKALKESLKAQGKDVILVDAGDHASGSTYANIDSGKTILGIMDQTGYDVAVPGNHELDYGLNYFLNTIRKTPKNFTYIASNFYSGTNTQFGDLVLDPYKIIDAGGKKVAFVGIMTPATISTTSIGYYQDEKGNWKYFISNATEPDASHTIYECVNSAVKSAKDAGADYVIAVGHLGDETASKSAGIDSATVVAHTRGLDAFIDGHSHTIHAGTGSDIVKDLDGKDVPILQAVSGIVAHSSTETEGINRIGQIIINTEGTLSCSIPAENELTSITPDTTVATAEKKWINDVDDSQNQKICQNEISFASGLKDIQREKANNLADFATDSFLYYVNTVPDKDGIIQGCDGVVFNGGCIRASVETGIVTTGNFLSVLPFINRICILEITGQTLLDMLEYGAKLIPGGYSGGFLQVSGVTYCIDTTIPCTVQIENGIWTGPPTGTYRVNDVKVYSKETGAYEPLDLNKIYKIGTTDYIANFGDGYNMIKGAVKHDNFEEDALTYKAMCYYASNFDKPAPSSESESGDETDVLPMLSTENSPMYDLEGYENYPMNYEDLAGASRIQIGQKITASCEGYQGVYDGVEHSPIVSTSVTEASVSYSIDGGITWDTKAPSIKNVSSVEVMVKVEKEGYISGTCDYSLEVTQRPLVVKGDSASITYDGKEHSIASFKSEGLLSGDVLSSITYLSKGTNVGSYIGEFSGTPKITASNGEDVTANYDITKTAGTLTINAAGSGKKTPNTGDGNDMLLWIMLALMAAVGAGAMTGVRKKIR